MNPCTAKLDLYLTQRKALIDYATAILGCREQAERLVQEAWLRFGAAQGEVRPSGLFRIVRNLARARVRPPVVPAVAPACEPQRTGVLHNVVSALRWYTAWTSSRASSAPTQGERGLRQRVYA